ncbi:MAG: single-stranded-DNA-specific exonuclease RecJ [Candidatus Limnocylindrales bacterium]
MAAPVPAQRWRLPIAEILDDAFLAEGARRGLSERTLRILAARGHRTAADLAAFYDPPASALHDPWLLPDAALVHARVQRAIAARERVLVFGDFDADGLTGCAILVLALRTLGLDAEPHVPDRLAEGHGLSLPAVKRARDEGRTLIFTVDTGTSSAVEITAAAVAGIDVIVTDHHHVPELLPPAVAVVNPQRHDSAYPDSRLAGTGVAFKVAQLLLADRPGGGAAAVDLADLAVIGTVADLAPIVGENRAIARLGLERLRTSPRPGLAALLDTAGVGAERVDLETIGYAIAPRLNAGGRMGDATTAVQLLLAPDAATAGPLAADLEIANRSRRELTATVLAEATAAAELDAEAPAIVLAGAWPVGIIGLVAGRLAEARSRPTVVFATGAEPWRGSARSPAGFDLAAAFEACAFAFERHGGHPGAAGCTMPAANLEAFRERFLALAAAAPLAAAEEGLHVDLIVSALDIDYRLYRDLQALEPTGAGNPRPLVGVHGLSVVRAREASGGHAQVTLRRGREVFDGVAFGRPDLATLAEGDLPDLVVRVASRTFGGYETLQLEIVDAAAAGRLGRAMQPLERAPA